MRISYSASQPNGTGVFGSNPSSYLTVLRPRDYAPSDILSTFHNFLTHEEEETWKHRAKLAFRILSFCLGPGNIWRFPEQSFIHGQATYIYLYFIYSWIFCISLLVFEISLSQYFMKGFAKLFTLCPIMEGITLAMALYCVMANYVYNLVGVYSLSYVISAFMTKMPHSYCNNELENEYGCHQNYTDLRHSPVYLFFHHYIERAVDITFGEHYNWRSGCIIAVIWIVLCAVVIFGVLKHHWITITLSLMIILSLFYVAIVTACLTGAGNGISRMFVPSGWDVGNLATWIYPVEQSLVTLGVGAGPLTTVWSLSKIKYWSRLDCVIVNALTFTCSLLAGITFFGSVGVLAYRSNQTIDDLFESAEDTNTFVVVTYSLSTIGTGFNNFTLFIYYFIMFCSCIFSLLEYTQIILLYVTSYITSKINRRRIIIFTCLVLLCLIANIGIMEIGYPLMRSINENFMATALLINICFELFSVTCLYGIRNFCDDVDFMLGFVPNYFFQATWLILPGLFAVFSIASVCIKFKKLQNEYDLFVWCLILLFTIVPIFAIGVYKCCVEFKVLGFKQMFRPKLRQSEWENTPGDGDLSASFAKDYFPEN